MSNLIIFAFQNTASENVLKEINHPFKELVHSNPDEITSFINKQLLKEPKYILGLGDYSGKDTDRLRIELSCSNKFRNKLLGERLETFQISEFLSSQHVSKYAKGIGNSYCNLISYKFAQNILRSNLETKYGFIHIPKEFDMKEAAKEIEKLISKLPVSN